MLTEADIIAICEEVTGERYEERRVRLGGTHRDVIVPTDDASESKRFLLTSGAGTVAVAQWGRNLGEVDERATAAFTRIAASKRRVAA